MVQHPMQANRRVTAKFDQLIEGSGLSHCERDGGLVTDVPRYASPWIVRILCTILRGLTREVVASSYTSDLHMQLPAIKLRLLHEIFRQSCPKCRSGKQATVFIQSSCVILLLKRPKRQNGVSPGLSRPIFLGWPALRRSLDRDWQGHHYRPVFVHPWCGTP